MLVYVYVYLPGFIIYLQGQLSGWSKYQSHRVLLTTSILPILL